MTSPTLTASVRKCASFKKKRGYPDSAVTTGKRRAQEIDREAALQTSQNKETNRIPFTLTYHPQNLAVKDVIIKNSTLISFKRNKNIGNIPVRSAFKSEKQPGTFKCTRTRCKTCHFISNMVKISGPNRSVKITDHLLLKSDSSLQRRLSLRNLENGVAFFTYCG